MYHTFIIHSFIDGLGYFHLLAIVSTIPMNADEYLCGRIQILMGICLKMKDLFLAF